MFLYSLKLGRVFVLGRPGGRPSVIPRLKKLVDVLCSALAAGALFAIMWLTLTDVSGRKLISTSVPGSLELTEGLELMVGR